MAVRTIYRSTAVFGLVLLAGSAPAEEPRTVEAKISELHGSGATVVRAEDRSTVPAASGLELFTGDRLKSGPEIEIALAFPDGTQVTVKPGSEILIGARAAHASGASSVLLVFGRLAAKVAKAVTDSGYSFEVHAANAVAGVRGTEFEVLSVGDESEVVVKQGQVGVTGLAGKEARVGPGELARASFDRPAESAKVDPAVNGETRWQQLEERSKGAFVDRAAQFERFITGLESRYGAARDEAKQIEAKIRDRERVLESSEQAGDDEAARHVNRELGALLKSFSEATERAQAAGFRLDAAGALVAWHQERAKSHSEAVASRFAALDARVSQFRSGHADLLRDLAHRAEHLKRRIGSAIERTRSAPDRARRHRQ
jgi:hypothetical protein